jgi:hypothetical protein
MATNNRMVLKPIEKVPLSALRWPTSCTKPACRRRCCSVDHRRPARDRRRDAHPPAVDLVTFTGGVAIGKYIAAKAGYRRTVLELGGNDPIIVMDDADLDEAASLAVQGSYKNSGQRCTAVKRIWCTEGGRASPTWWSTRPAPGPMATRRPEASRHGHRDRRIRRAAVRARVDEAVARARGCWPATSATARCIRPR